MQTDQSRGLMGTYEQFLWGLMDLLGVTKTVRRKMMVATLLQFGAIVTIFVLGVGMLGFGTFLEVFTTIEMAIFAIVLVLSVGALLNTILILQRDFVDPIEEMKTAAEVISEGELDEGVPATDQPDEIGELQRRFGRMHEYLQTVSAQAEALSREEFDAAVLEEEVPGSFGAALQRMEANLEERIEDLQTQREEIQARNAELTQTAEEYQRIIRRVADGDLTYRLNTETDHEAMSGIARAFNEMVGQWEEMLGEHTDFAEQVAEESEAVQQNAQEVRNASEDISESVQEISAGVDQESQRLDETSGESENLSATIQEITASSDNVATLTEQTAEVGETGQDAAQAAESEMDALRQSSEAVT
ncbi:MAG: HAMP domain-containing protein, partial [Halodesulfurarchaeum sp.]